MQPSRTGLGCSRCPPRCPPSPAGFAVVAPDPPSRVIEPLQIGSFSVMQLNLYLGLRCGLSEWSHGEDLAIRRGRGRGARDDGAARCCLACRSRIESRNGRSNPSQAFLEIRHAGSEAHTHVAFSPGPKCGPRKSCNPYLVE